MPTPPPPPPATTDLPRYVAYLTKIGSPTDDLYEAENLRVGDWRFYMRGSSMPKQNAVGLDSAGRVVGAGAGDQWHAFLSTPGLDPAAALAAYAWLTSSGVVIPHVKIKDPVAAKLVAPTTLERAPDGTLTLTGWTISPPDMQTPYRVQIIAPPAGTARIEHASWKKVAAAAKAPSP